VLFLRCSGSFSTNRGQARKPKIYSIKKTNGKLIYKTLFSFTFWFWRFFQDDKRIWKFSQVISLESNRNKTSFLFIIIFKDHFLLLFEPNSRRHILELKRAMLEIYKRDSLEQADISYDADTVNINRPLIVIISKTEANE
jgi:hypothetical protein